MSAARKAIFDAFDIQPHNAERLHAQLVNATPEQLVEWSAKHEVPVNPDMEQWGNDLTTALLTSYREWMDGWTKILEQTAKVEQYSKHVSLYGPSEEALAILN